MRWGKKNMIRMMLILCSITGLICACSPAHQSGTAVSSGQPSLTKDDAIRLARQACHGTIEVPTNAAAVVSETNENYVVTFPQPYQDGVLHGDIYAEVVIDKVTGRVVGGLRSP